MLMVGYQSPLSYFSTRDRARVANYGVRGIGQVASAGQKPWVFVVVREHSHHRSRVRKGQ